VLVLAVLAVTGPALFLVGNPWARHTAGDTFHWILTCLPLEVVGAFMAAAAIRRVKADRAPEQPLRAQLVLARALFWLSLTMVLLMPLALLFLFALALGLSG
jgi:hypothetical protein